jgi:uncharacterized DUF497 family protein
MDIEWYDSKAASNLEKHGVSFDEAASVFMDLRARTIFDELHSDQEDRFLTLGFSDRGRMLIVWHTDRGSTSVSLVHEKQRGMKQTVT